MVKRIVFVLVAFGFLLRLVVRQLPHDISVGVLAIEHKHVDPAISDPGESLIGPSKDLFDMPRQGVIQPEGLDIPRIDRGDDATCRLLQPSGEEARGAALKGASFHNGGRPRHTNKVLVELAHF